MPALKLFTRKGADAPFFVRVDTGPTEPRELPNGMTIQSKVYDWVQESDPAKSGVLTALYADVMADVGGGYTLISFDVVEQCGAFHGIANFRVGTDHRQKRF